MQATTFFAVDCMKYAHGDFGCKISLYLFAILKDVTRTSNLIYIRNKRGHNNFYRQDQMEGLRFALFSTIWGLGINHQHKTIVSREDLQQQSEQHLYAIAQQWIKKWFFQFTKSVVWMILT